MAGIVLVQLGDPCHNRIAGIFLRRAARDAKMVGKRVVDIAVAGKAGSVEHIDMFGKDIGPVTVPSDLQHAVFADGPPVLEILIVLADQRDGIIRIRRAGAVGIGVGDGMIGRGNGRHGEEGEMRAAIRQQLFPATCRLHMGDEMIVGTVMIVDAKGTAGIAARPRIARRVGDPVSRAVLSPASVRPCSSCPWARAARTPALLPARRYTGAARRRRRSP